MNLKFLEKKLLHTIFMQTKVYIAFGLKKFIQPIQSKTKQIASLLLYYGI